MRSKHLGYGSIACLLSGGVFLLAQSTQTVLPVLRSNADCTAAIQAMIDALPAKGGEVKLPAGTFVISRPLNLTRHNYHSGPGEKPDCYISLVGSGYGTILLGTMRAGPVIDLTDSSYCSIRDMQVRSDTAQAGVLLARPNIVNPPSCGWHQFERLWIGGHYSVAAVYNVSSEVDSWRSCIFQNLSSSGFCVVFSHDDFAKCASPYVGALGASSCADQRFFNCSFWQSTNGDATPSATIYVRGWAEDVSVIDCDFGVHGNQKAAIWLDASNGLIKHVDVIGNRFESDVPMLAGGGWGVSFTRNNCYGKQPAIILADAAAEWEVSGNLFSVPTGGGVLQFKSLAASTIERNRVSTADGSSANISIGGGDANRIGTNPGF